jgi:protein arginine kinase activator
MICQNCGNHEANVKYTQIINGDKTQLYLCEECAEKMNIGAKFNFDNIFSGFFNDFSGVKTLPAQEIAKCPNCGMTYDDFANIGKFGCEKCYKTFENRIDKVLKKIHGNNRHIGKNSNRTMGSETVRSDIKVEKKKTELEKLKEELQECIKKEDYEKAAKIRDKIKEIEKNNLER